MTFTAQDSKIEQIVDQCSMLEFVPKLAIVSAIIGSLYMAHCAHTDEYDALLSGFLEEIGDIETADALSLATGLIHQLCCTSTPN